MLFGSHVHAAAMRRRQRRVLAASPVAEGQTLFASMLDAVEDECDSSKPCTLPTGV